MERTKARERLLLTSTGRLARKLVRELRKDRISQGEKGWELPDVISLNAWIEREWTDSWPVTLPAPDMFRMGIWKSILNNAPPPSPLEPTADLCRQVDDTFGVLVRHGINPAAGRPSTPLVEWRRHVCGLFGSRLSEEGFFHPSELALHVARGLEDGSIPAPSEFAALGFEFPSPVERELFAVLSSLCRQVPNNENDRPAGTVSAVSLPTPEQEIIYLCRRLAEDALNVPLHRIGVIVPDLEAIRDALEAHLTDVLGTPRGKECWFNMTLGPVLSSLPLVKAAALPLRFFMEGERRETLLTLMLSSYYGFWRGRRGTLARADRLWRSEGIDGNLNELKRSLKGLPEDPGRDIIRDDTWRILDGLRQAIKGKRQPLSKWVNWMEETWTALGFPVTADEEDSLAWRHLSGAVAEMRAYMGDVLVNGPEFLDWLSTHSSRERTQAERPEDAGIQVMGIIEARGLEFDRLYLMNMNDGSFPRPVRPLPLLDGSERALIQGGTSESQFVFAEAAFRRILRSAPATTLLRAEQNGDTPLTPSPFWPEEAETDICDIWLEPNAAWMRVTWFRSAWKGLLLASANGEGLPCPVDDPLPGDLFRARLRRGLSPYRLKTALACPFKFLVNILLGIEPLEQVTPPPSPRERGKRIHRVLALFTKKMRDLNMESLEDRGEAWEVLRRCTENVFSADAGGSINWRLEMERLLGSPESKYPGILGSWLDMEREHRAEGWRCVAEEIAFSDLSISRCPFPLNGVIDRVDFNPDSGWACLDYKTGTLPSGPDVTGNFLDPQLAVYLMALRDGRVKGLQPTAPYGLSGGYIHIKTIAEIGYRFIAGLEDSLEDWEKIIADMGERLAAGTFDPSPYPFSRKRDRKNACADCGFLTLCVQGLRESFVDESDEGDEPEKNHDL